MYFFIQNLIQISAEQLIGETKSNIALALKRNNLNNMSKVSHKSGFKLDFRIHLKLVMEYVVG